ncbi:hypothetical protein HO173_012375 [Letharia columbiana]|uniref:NAD(P)-binding domain-containing protein n=1 Tax=Letharia columbiana TaxID=112416 RepID=A0A8H6CNH5_9LECA|nr:uncharacterized protein HO173_012375 [Letharia columbiana]KAF6226708.1 hypothetical protein HO173_012375 [Letharia columbiana]
MPVLLLGATGNLGSRLLPALLAHRQKVVVYVRNELKLRESIPSSILSQVTVVNGDATDSTSIKNALVENECDSLINSAGQASVLPWSEPQMQEIIKAVATGAVDASKELNRPIRAWFMGGMSVLDFPGMEGIQLMKYIPLFTEHNLTYIYLSKQKNLQWSMFCPSNMIPASKTVTLLDAPRGNPLNASADVPPGFQNSYFHNIPYLGPIISSVGNAPKYGTTLEDCADFIAADLEKKDTRFVGHRVGVIDAGTAGKGKTE